MSKTREMINRHLSGTIYEGSGDIAAALYLGQDEDEGEGPNIRLLAAVIGAVVDDLEQVENSLT